MSLKNLKIPTRHEIKNKISGLRKNLKFEQFLAMGLKKKHRIVLNHRITIKYNDFKKLLNFDKFSTMEL